MNEYVNNIRKRKLNEPEVYDLHTFEERLGRANLNVTYFSLACDPKKDENMNRLEYWRGFHAGMLAAKEVLK